jgi:hypothetical protein
MGQMTTLKVDHSRILSEAAVVARCIRRYERRAQLTGRLDEAEAMHRLGYGVARMALRLTPEREAVA